jgi:N-methylhydantoinase B
LSVNDTVDPVTLAVVSGALDNSVREMTITMRRAAMSPVLAIGNDFSNAIFDGTARMVLQGHDQPVHLGAMIFACKEVARYFGADLAPGDVIYHNDPRTGGSHLQDMTLYKPVFVGDELAFWTVNRSHMDETGGPVAGGYNPTAEEIWAEGLRISPVKIYEAGRPRRDVIDLLLTNFRTRRQFRGDLGAQLAACTMAERRLVQLVERYGLETVRACLEALLNRAESLMRAEISRMPDGEYEGRAVVEDDGHGSGDLEVVARVRINGDHMAIQMSAPRQTHSYINSYAANSIGAVYLGVVTYIDPLIPHNEGLYRPLEVGLGAAGSVINAQEPAACSMSTSTPFGHIAEAVRTALATALSDRAGGGWAKICIDCFTGIDPRNNEPYAYLSHLTGWGGGGAFSGQDGEPVVGPIEVAGAAMTGDVELLEYMLPLQIHRYELRPDSGCPGRWRGGPGTVVELSPIDHATTVAFLGDGMKYPAPSVGGPVPSGNRTRTFQKWIVEADGSAALVRLHSVHQLNPRQVLREYLGGGGGVGDPFERPPEQVLSDWRNDLVSLESCRTEYGVAINAGDGRVDEIQTANLRKFRGGTEK